MSKKEEITIVCYGKKEVWDNRQKALDYYEEAMLCTEGSESERYRNIYNDLKNGLTVCSD